MAGAVTSAFLAAGASVATSTTAGIVVSTAAGLAIKFGPVVAGLAQARQGQAGSQTGVRRRLEIPTPLVADRTAYGRTRVVGSPLTPYKNGRQVYGAMILNDRPSQGGDINVLTDSRPSPAAVEPWGNLDNLMQGDVYDFTGIGFAPQPDPFVGFREDGTNADFFRIWIGRGDQTAPPDRILSEASVNFTASDSGEGLTVLWYRLDLGDDDIKMFKRWPTLPKAPPSIEVMMDTSRVWDPRDVAQDPDDPDTWLFSENCWLITLDAARNNPIAPRTLDQIHLASFIEAADGADDAIALKRGGTEARYRVSGTIDWENTNLQAALESLAAAGAGRLIDIGGRIAAVPGEWQAPIYTLSNITTAQVASFDNLKLARDVPSAVSAICSNPENQDQPESLPRVTVLSGGGSEQRLDLSLAASVTQARRVQVIEARRLAAQKTFSAEAYPDAAKLVPWSNVTLDIPGFEIMDGTYRVVMSDPTAFLDGEGRAALRTALSLEEHNEATYSHAPGDELETLIDVVTDATVAETFSATGLAPKSQTIVQVQLYRAATGSDFSAAVAVGAAEDVEGDESFSFSISGLASGESDFWIACLDESAAVIGTPNGPFTETII